jgi:signal recognition particle receptor subunit beta
VSSYKIVVTGPFNTGKTQFIKTISDIPVVSTEKRVTNEDQDIKSETTVAMDFGRVQIDDDILYLYGTPGQVRFEFMWEILAHEMDGYLVLVDSTTPETFDIGAQMLDLFSTYTDAPRLLVATKADLPGAARLDVVRQSIGSADVTVIPCNTTQKSSARQVLLQILPLLG